MVTSIRAGAMGARSLTTTSLVASTPSTGAVAAATWSLEKDGTRAEPSRLFPSIHRIRTS